MNEIKGKEDDPSISIETIFMQLLRKQKEKPSEENLLRENNNYRYI